MTVHAVTGATILLALVTLARLAELALAAANTARLRAAGAREIGARHYPALVALHAAWLAALWGAGAARPVDLGWLGLFLVLQALRVWVIATLGRRWTTRILVLPGVPRIRRGPYRWLAHPNYAVVAGEIAVLPLALGLPVLALVFSALNAALLAIRIRAESAALEAAPPRGA